MPIEHEHNTRLHDDLEAHDERLRFVRQQMDYLAEEAAVHETILRLGRDERLMALLGDLAGNSEQLDLVGENPVGYFVERGVEAPDGLADVVVDRARGGVSATFRSGRYRYVLSWTPDGGFTNELVEGE